MSHTEIEKKLDGFPLTALLDFDDSNISKNKLSIQCGNEDFFDSYNVSDLLFNGIDNNDNNALINNDNDKDEDKDYDVNDKMKSPTHPITHRYLYLYLYLYLYPPT